MFYEFKCKCQKTPFSGLYCVLSPYGKQIVSKCLKTNLMIMGTPHMTPTKTRDDLNL